MGELNPQECAPAFWAAWQDLSVWRASPWQSGSDSPLHGHRRWINRSLVGELVEASESAEYKRILPWGLALLEARALFPWENNIMRIWHEPSLETDRLPQRGLPEVSLSRIRLEWLRSKDCQDAVIFLDAMRKQSDEVRGAEQKWQEQRGEFWFQLEPFGLRPEEYRGSDGAVERDDLAQVLKAHLPVPKHPSESVREAMALHADGDWPPRLSKIFYEQVFGGDSPFWRRRLPTPQTIEVIGGASFARALDHFGTGLFAASLKGDPIQACSSTMVQPTSFGMLMSLLVTEPLFHRKALGMGDVRARDQAREMCTSFCRWMQSRLFVEGARGSSAKQRSDLSEQVWGVGMSEEDAAILFQLASLPLLPLQHAQAFVGALVMTRALRDRFDEDWFRNPRAHELLIEEGSHSLTGVGEVGGQGGWNRSVVVGWLKEHPVG